jgi:tetratricopeptide (TPR) repeat protein
MVAMAAAARNESDAPLLARAEQVVDAVARRDPKNYALDIYSAYLRHLQGRYEEEVKFYREALALRPGDPEATNNLAWILSEGLNRPGEALPLIDSLIARVGRKPDVLDTRGVILARLNRLDEAIADLEEAVRAAPSAVGHFHLALACRKAGRDAEFRRSRELARRAGLSPPQADRTDRPEVASMMQF